MRRNKIILGTFILFAYFSGLTKAETIQLDLFTLGMPANFTYDSNSTFDDLDWQANFDLGVTFSQISHVYMDWSGEITAGLAASTLIPGGPFPKSIEMSAHLKNVLTPISPSDFRYAAILGGQTTYPDPQPFVQTTEFVQFSNGNMLLSDLFDGQGTICLGYLEPIILEGGFVQHGSITLNHAILVIDGTIIPEPTTLVFLAIGLPVFRFFSKRKS